MDFINDAIGRGTVSSSMYLANIQIGFEIWDGGVGLQTHDFWVSL